jgi:hypothetical protein
VSAQTQNLESAQTSVNLNELDVTGTVQVTNPEVVKQEVLSIFNIAHPKHETERLARAFDLFKQLYQGVHPDYFPCDTIYHDMQHSLDVTLTTTRILKGHQQAHGILKPDDMLLGIVTALFHDSGYLRRRKDDDRHNGAEYTGTHVSRSGEFMQRHFPELELQQYIHSAREIVHLTGYEKQPDQVRVADEKDRLVGNIVATADLITQMADRCYLEKCRDRLYPELVLGSMDRGTNPLAPAPLFKSAQDLLQQTPDFYRRYVRKRLKQYFQDVFQYAGVFFNGNNPYIDRIEKTIGYLEELLAEEHLDALRRIPPENYGVTVFPFSRIQQWENLVEEEPKKNPK